MKQYPTKKLANFKYCIRFPILRLLPVCSRDNNSSFMPISTIAMYKKVPDTAACMVATNTSFICMLDSNTAAIAIPIGELKENKSIIVKYDSSVSESEAAVMALPNANPAKTL
eukprot:CAMPEP_0172438432 /NCGR_PEP_ID=MMETSP1064-20121228/72795_1 /TAXON_ID=202472 /ORGANISM="Aulacoseira subarctica , Strain CCAP 1002/5" /LENGTH=112 /DNA_ID=CAMNT_0013186985 /DNA_START=179 /DNA_END=517 /DNA_ORIENTATION=+